MLLTALDISGCQHLTKKELCGDMSNITDTMQQQRLAFSRQCWKNKKELAVDVSTMATQSQ